MADHLFFISYKSEERDFADKVKDFVEDCGFVPWIDDRIKLGDDWRKVIDKAIEDSVGVIVVVTRASMKSQYVTYEWSYAMGLGKTVIPVYFQDPAEEPEDRNEKPLKDCLHPKLVLYQGAMVWDDESTEWDKLAERLNDVYRVEHIPPIVSALQNAILQNVFRPVERIDIINALKDTEHKSATDLLANLIDIPLPKVKLEASIALAEKSNYTDERAIHGIVDAIKLLGGLRRGVLETLVEYDNKLAVQAMQSLLEYVKENEKNNIVDKVDQFDTSEVIPLVVSLYREGNRRTSIHNAIEKHRISTIVPDLIANLDYTTPDNRHFYYNNVIKILGEIGDKSALPALFEVFNSRLYYREEHDAVRAAIIAVGQIACQESLDKLIEVRNHKPSARNSFQQLLDENILRLKKELGVD